MALCKKEVALVVAVAVLACMGMAQATINCGTVSSRLSPCLGYLTSPGTAKAAAPSGCCGGVKSLYSTTKPSRPDRIIACNCIKSLSAALGSKLNAARVGALPVKCGVPLGYTPSVSTNCATIP